jgi:hypothetical protein
METLESAFEIALAARAFLFMSLTDEFEQEESLPTEVQKLLLK